MNTNKYLNRGLTILLSIVILLLISGIYITIVTKANYTPTPLPNTVSLNIIPPAQQDFETRCKIFSKWLRLRHKQFSHNKNNE